MKLLLVAGARPNFMKIASIVDAIHAHNAVGQTRIDYILVHTGQHYDDKMSHAFFKDLGIPEPTVNLEVGSGSHAAQTAEVMKRFEPVLIREQPDAVIVVGDVNSTIACSLVTSKISYPNQTPGSRSTRPLLAHIEAGLRSGDWSMPEEVNRVLTDVLGDLLFITESSAIGNLRREGISKERIHFVGNTMVDTLLKHRKKAQKSMVLRRLGLEEPGKDRARLPYTLVTLHRPSNVDNRDVFEEILHALTTVGNELPVIFPVHPRTGARIKDFGFEQQCQMLGQADRLDCHSRGVFGVEPLGYLDFLCLTSNARLVLTDSGGIQEETTALGVPCVTMRNNTERPVTVTQGTNVLAGTRKVDIVAHALKKLRRSTKSKRPQFWDGHAGERIIRVLVRKLSHRRTKLS